MNISHRYVPHEECLGNSIKYYYSSILLDVKQNLRYQKLHVGIIPKISETNRDFRNQKRF